VTANHSSNVSASTGFRHQLRKQFIMWGILPVLLVVLIVTFTLMEPRFLSGRNILNVARQVSFLGVITIGQMFYLVMGKYDLSNGATVALSSIMCASVIVALADWNPWQAILLGCLAGLAVGLVFGVINSVLIAYFRISSFIVTLGVASIGTGLALMISGGVPVVGLPPESSRSFGTSTVAGIPFPTLILMIVLAIAYVLFVWTRLGRHAYAVGGNESAAYHSGVNVERTLFVVMVSGSLLAALVGIMITARVGTGEANIGLQYPLLSIIAAVLGGVSLSGGSGRVAGAFMGALFIVLLSNGMDLIRVQSYVQHVLLGVLLIAALIVDRLRTDTRG
jgi:ribose transport system permease protein